MDKFFGQTTAILSQPNFDFEHQETFNKQPVSKRVNREMLSMSDLPTITDQHNSETTNAITLKF
jgi:hypothetical protein